MTMSDLVSEIKVDMGIDVVSLAISDTSIELKIKEALRKISSYAPKLVVGTYPRTNVIDMPEGTQCVLGIIATDYTSNANVVDNDVFSWTTMMYNSGGAIYDPFTILTLRNQVNTLQGFISIRDYHFDRLTKKLYISNLQGSGNLAIKYMLPYTDIEEIDDEMILQKLKEYSLALCKIVEGMIRRKTQSTPGAMQLDGDALVSEGTAERDRLDQELPAIFKYLCMGIRV